MDQSSGALAAFYASLATKRVGAGLVCRDERDRILLVQPTYKPGWEIPGGAVEADESPAAAARREAREELGVDVPVGRLLVVDWLPARPPKTEGLMFLFDGGTITLDEAQAFTLPPDELRAWRFVEVASLSGLVSTSMARRLQAAVAALAQGSTSYLEPEPTEPAS